MKLIVLPVVFGALLVTGPAQASGKRGDQAVRAPRATASKAGRETPRNTLGRVRAKPVSMKLAGPLTLAALSKRLGATAKYQRPMLRLTLTDANARDIQEMLDNGDDQGLIFESNASQAITAWSAGVLPSMGYDLSRAKLIVTGTRAKPAYIAVIPAPQEPPPYEIVD